MLNLELYKQFYKLGRYAAYQAINKNEEGKTVIGLQYQAAYDALYAVDTEVALACHEVYCEAYAEIIRMFGV